MKQLTPIQVYQILLAACGPQQWWPADSPFEVMIGAILTQNTNWKNVEKAISNLKKKQLLDATGIAVCDPDKLALAIRPSGFYRQKGERLQLFSRFYIDQGELSSLQKRPATELRKLLLNLHGIGPETADSILLYALNKPLFVVDAYTKRIFTRIGLFDPSLKYDAVQAYFHQHLGEDLLLFQEFHALIVEHAKRFCKTSPLCESCPLAKNCLFYHQSKLS